MSFSRTGNFKPKSDDINAEFQELLATIRARLTLSEPGQGSDPEQRLDPVHMAMAAGDAWSAGVKWKKAGEPKGVGKPADDGGGQAQIQAKAKTVRDGAGGGVRGALRLRQAGHARLAMGGEAICMPPCLFCMDNHECCIQGRMKITNAIDGP